MANILIFNYMLPYPAYFNGNTLRVFFLSKELARSHNCFLLTFGDNNQHKKSIINSLDFFRDVRVIRPPMGRRRLIRHLHLNTGDQTRTALPKEYNRIVNSIHKLIDKCKIQCIVAFTGELAEYVIPCSGIPKILELIDCRSMALQRQTAYSTHTLWNKLRATIALKRKRHIESEITKFFDLVTTVSPIDRDFLRWMNKNGQDRIIDIPNGVNPEIFHVDIPNDQIKGGMAFWGALDFPPNLTAVHYFYDKVFKPFLSDKDLVWYIIGKNPSKKMREFAKEHRNIKLTGYVNDLYGLIARIPIVINPMQIGGGLKNKVLEAFALERLVVSNAVGMEAMVSAKPGIHYIHAETPSEFADTIIKYSVFVEKRSVIGKSAKRLIKEQYTWGKVGARYLDLIDAVLNRKIKRTV